MFVYKCINTNLFYDWLAALGSLAERTVIKWYSVPSKNVKTILIGKSFKLLLAFGSLKCNKEVKYVLPLFSHTCYELRCVWENLMADQSKLEKNHYVTLSMINDRAD